MAPRHGQMVINMKTTVTTNGTHSGLVVHSAVQSSPSTSSNSPWSPGTSMPVMETQTVDCRPINGRDYQSSPMPIQMLPSTSQETLNSFHSRPISPPESPTFSFKGGDSPPDEFIQPTKLVLNIFKPFEKTESYPLANNIGGGIQLSKGNGLLNDAVTTMTTVEVFRAPTSNDLPTISIPPAPYHNQPLLIRANGPSYESWQNSRTETAIDNRVQYPYAGPKGVQWKEKLIENGSQRSYDPYEEIPYGYQLRREDPIAHSPSESSQSYVSALRPFSSSSNIAYRTPNESRIDRRPIDRPLSPLYVVPDRFRTFEPHDPAPRGRYSQERYKGPRTTKRSKSTDGSRLGSRESLQYGSQELVSNFGGSTQTLASPNPNDLPGRPASARSQEIFALYQTRDALNRVIDQL